jgi:fructose-1,6-bisphosphatase/inositol monophosphatase family enzyme
MFLIQQSGGIITDLSGNEWNFNSTGLIAANNKDLHQQLLEAYLHAN